MQKFSLYTNVRANQLKMAIFLVGFLLIASPEIAEAKLITVGASTDPVSIGNNLGIGSTAPTAKLHIFDKVSNYATINIEGPTDSADKGAAILFNEGNGATQWDGGLYGFKVAYDGGNNYLFFEGFGNGTSQGKHLNILRTGNVGIGLTNPGAKLDITGTLRNSLATTHSLLGGAGNAVVMADNNGTLFSMDTSSFASSAANVSTLYHIKKWFTPQSGQTISSSGTTVTMANPVSNYQFSSSMVGSRLTISGESRVITAYTSTSVVTVDSAYSTNYSNVDYTLWGVYSKAVDIASDGSISTYSETGSMAIRKRSGDTNTYIPALLDLNSNYYLPSSSLYLDKDFPIKWSNSTNYSSSSGNDVGLRRSAAGTLEIYDGQAATPGTAGTYKNLNIGSLYAEGNIGVGTTAPWSRLTVRGTTSEPVITRGAPAILSVASADGVEFAFTSATAWPWTASIQVRDVPEGSGDSTYPLALNPLGGNVGIGTTNPTSNLTLGGSGTKSIARDTAAGNLDLYGGIDYTDGAYFKVTGNTLNANPGNSSGEFTIGEATGTYASNFAINSFDGSTWTPRLKVVGSSGNIGIGTTAPTQKLDVNGNINIASSTALMYGGVNIVRAVTARQNYFFGNGGNLTMTGSANVAAGYTGLVSNTTGSWNVAIGDALSANTTGYGNTAINDAALDLNVSGNENTAVGDDAMYNTTGSYNSGYGGAVMMDLTSGTYNTAVGYNTGRGITTGSNNTIIGSRVSGLSASLANNIIIADGAGNQRINVDSSGNVGIGVTNPGMPFHVQNSSNLGIRFQSAVNATTTLDLVEQTTVGDGDGGRIKYDGTNNVFQLGTLLSGAETMALTIPRGSANVGIGTNTPNDSLTINVPAGTSKGISFKESDSATYGARIYYKETSDALFLNTVSISSEVPGISIARDTGNVGIGNPSLTEAKLSVNGSSKLGSAGTAFTAMGTCTIAASVITTTKVNKTCTGIPASTAVAVSCTGSAAFSGTSTIYCRPTGTADQLACNTIATNTTSMSYTCMWMQP